MDLFLLRHGIAEERFDGLDHPERALTCEGLARTAAVARSLVKHGVQVDLLLTSPFRRALETAQIAMDAGLASELRVEAALEPGDPLRRLSGTSAVVSVWWVMSRTSAPWQRVCSSFHRPGSRSKKPDFCSFVVSRLAGS